MSIPDECNIRWFTVFMALSNDGVVPTVTPTDLMPSRVALAHFLGPKHNLGFTFINHGNRAYELYVRELHQRVLQLKWPISGVLPFHFARGLAAQAMGMCVNWAEFGYKQTHPHQSRIGAYRILPEFENLSAPLPPLIKIIPRGNFTAHGFIDSDKNSPVEDRNHENSSALVWKTSPPLTRSAVPATAEGSPSTRHHVRQVNRGKEKIDSTAARLRAAALDGLSFIRKQVTVVVEAEQMKLQEARHDYFRRANNISVLLKDKKVRLKDIQNILATKVKSQSSTSWRKRFVSQQRIQW
ncbi:hypothetical protein KC19_VG139600 [Ceratodon purpureus]|uniref:Uncharacterized protein n=1 Tax=Ceratodon purpureus TaxID=3225 RepID=A0A8T0HR19_CERPU|nr:hypothetical protein KC19_VG139600 [Ceratodon purpureus]